jgi:Fe-S-cluster-containing hydrogenase component 2
MAWRPAWWFGFLKVFWPLPHLGIKATGIPVAGKAFTSLARPLLGKDNFHVTYIPINANIHPATSTVLTQGIIAELIRRSAHRVIVRRCSCRDSKGCQDYPVEDACLLLGFDTINVRSEIARHVSVEEALRHLDRMAALGLTPMAGRVRMDELFYGVPTRKRMMTICFCCPCCCAVLNSAKYFPEEFKSSIVKLQGTRILVDMGKCKHCGICAEACFVEAIALNNGSVLHDHVKCIGCGRCTTACPEGAASLVIDDPEAAVEEVLGRIRQRANIE